MYRCDTKLYLFHFPIKCFFSDCDELLGIFRKRWNKHFVVGSISDI